MRHYDFIAHHHRSRRSPAQRPLQAGAQKANSYQLEEMTKKANLTEKAVIGFEQLYLGPGYTFSFRVTVKFICCGQNKWPEPKVRPLSQKVASEEGQTADGVYSLRMPGDMKQLGQDIQRTIKELTEQAKSECAALASKAKE